MVVAIAIVILPSLYAWLNIYSNWDPYGNTGGISIAVASLDEDYTTPEGETVNKGRDVLDDLRESTSINWVVVDTQDEAVEGVRESLRGEDGVLRITACRQWVYDVIEAANAKNS